MSGENIKKFEYSSVEEFLTDAVNHSRYGKAFKEKLLGMNPGMQLKWLTNDNYVNLDKLKEKYPDVKSCVLYLMGHIPYYEKEFQQHKIVNNDTPEQEKKQTKPCNWILPDNTRPDGNMMPDWTGWYDETLHRTV